MIKIKNDSCWFFVTGNLKLEKVREWYTGKYPDDELGKSINENVTMWDIVGLLNTGLGGRLYDELHAGDSVIRERLFERIAEIVHCDYDTVYNTWLEVA